MEGVVIVFFMVNSGLLLVDREFLVCPTNDKITEVDVTYLEPYTNYNVVTGETVRERLFPFDGVDRRFLPEMIYCHSPFFV